MEALRAWNDAAAIILSCPGPARRHKRAITSLADLHLPQILLGGESQLRAFAAAAPDLASRLFFTPVPEIFPNTASVRAALPDFVPQHEGPLTHLRFGGVRSARVIKGVRNGAVMAESANPAPLSASQHPFASGMVLPASMRRVFVYHPGNIRPLALGGSEMLPAARLEGCITADLTPPWPAPPWPVPDTAALDIGLDLVSLANFRSRPWANGPVRPPAGLSDRAQQPGTIFLPWNMDHPGSIVPAMLERLAQLNQPDSAPLRAIILPFNYTGQTGNIRRLIQRLRTTAYNPENTLAQFSLARVSSPAGIGLLASLGGPAWVDGNDPEAWWVLARLAACGIATILLDPELTPATPLPATARIAADEPVLISAGSWTVPARIPAWRHMRLLLEQTQALAKTASFSEASSAAKPPAGSARPKRTRRAPAPK